MATAPPLGFSARRAPRSPRAGAAARAAPPSAWAAKASCTSHTSMSVGANCARVSALAMAKAGAIPMNWGSSAYVADATTRASGVRPRDWRGPLGGQEDGARTIAERRRVACSHLRRVRLGREHGQLLGRRVAPDRLVVLKAATGVFLVAGDLDRMDLGREPTRVTGGGGMLVRAQREGVDLLAAQLITVGHVLRGLDHLDVRIAGQQNRVRRAARPRPHRVEQEHRTPWAEWGFAFHIAPTPSVTWTPPQPPIRARAPRCEWHARWRWRR